MSTLDEKLLSVLKELFSFSDDEGNTIIKNIPNELEKLRLYHVLRSKRLFNSYITPDGINVKWLFEFFLLEAIIFYQKGHKDKKMKHLFRSCLSYEEKLRLLMAFKFSKPFKHGNFNGECRHVMFETVKADLDFKQKHHVIDDLYQYCSSKIDACQIWLKNNRDRIDEFLNHLVNRFFEIRNAVVHESFPIFIMPTYQGKHTAASYSETLLDVYPILGGKKFRAYECDMDPADFFTITTNCIKNYLLNSYLK